MVLAHDMKIIMAICFIVPVHQIAFNLCSGFAKLQFAAELRLMPDTKIQYRKICLVAWKLVLLKASIGTTAPTASIIMIRHPVRKLSDIL